MAVVKNAPSGLAWYRVAVVYFVVAVGFGLMMNVSGNQMYSVHTHINLLGWVSAALIGLIYENLPQIGRNRLAQVQFWLYNIALPVMMVTLVARYRGNMQYESLQLISSVGVGVAILMFAGNVLWNQRKR
jgi:hypothetical protein